MAPQMGERRTDEPHDGPRTNHRLTVAQAADRLGIKEGAVRSRIKRGTLPTVKEGDRVYVVLDVGPSEASHTPDPEGPPGEPSNPRELVEEMRARIDDLREQLDQERQANRENRRIIAGLIERVPELTASAPQEPRGAAEDDLGTYTPADQTSPQTAAQPRSWWRRLIGS